MLFIDKLPQPCNEPKQADDDDQPNGMVFKREGTIEKAVRMAELLMVIPAAPLAIAIDMAKASPEGLSRAAKILAGFVIKNTKEGDINCIVALLTNIVDKKA